MNKDQEAAMQALHDIGEMFDQVMKDVETEQEDYWNSLTHDQQLMVFCSVVRRIHKGELKDKTSYRGILYDVFGFGMESYVQAQYAGYIDIHNAIDRKSPA